jgi:WXG100 family type VII secretion target
LWNRREPQVVYPQDSDGSRELDGVDVDGFDAAPVELQVCGSMLGQIGNDLHTEMGVLQREMDALLTGGWRGSAATGFAEGWELWQQGAKDVLDALQAMGRLLGETGQDYQRTDTSGADAVRESGAGA